MNRFFARTAATALGIASIVIPQLVAAQATQPEDTHARVVGREAVTAERFMVATANPHATRVGYEVLASGGSAIDAAVAVQIMLNLVEPQSSGIGGGAFLVYWDAGAGKLITLDGRETAPAAATPDYFLAQDGNPKGYWESVVGGRSVGVPGTLRLLEVAHKMHGRKAWAGLLQPTIDLAREGFEISSRMAASIEGAAGEKRQLDKYPAARAYFFEPDGSPKQLARNADGDDVLFFHSGRPANESGVSRHPQHYRGPGSECVLRGCTCR